MVTLKGGSRYRNKNRWQRFISGRKQTGTVAWQAERKKRLGEGSEGSVQLVAFHLQSSRGKSQRTVMFAVKNFFPDIPVIGFRGTWRDPKRQFKFAEALVQLNKKKKLGLRLPGTIRLIDEGALWFAKGIADQRYSIVSTYYPGAEWQQADYGRSIEFKTDRSKQQKIAEENGWYVPNDAFLEITDLKTKRRIAVIGDFRDILPLNRIPRQKSQ